VVLIVGIFWSVIISILIKGFGQLIENSEEIKQNTSKITKAIVKQNKDDNEN